MFGRIKPYSKLDCLNILVKGLIENAKPVKISFTYNEYNQIETIKTYVKNTLGEVVILKYYIFLYNNGEFVSIMNFDVDGGFVEVTDINTDFPLIGDMYYEVIDFSGNVYSVFVDSEDLVIPDNSVIYDEAGYVRLKGVNMPCMIAIRNYSTVTKNTEGTSLMELQSDFENSGSVIGLKTLLNNVNFYGI